MTALDLRALAEAATPGPWGARYFDDGDKAESRRFAVALEMSAGDITYRLIAGAADACQQEGGSEDWLNLGFMGNGPTSGANAAYIAAASPDVILALLDEIDALRDVAETALQDTLTVMADDMRLRDADVILQRNTGSGRERGRADDIDARAADHLEREAEGLTGPRSLR